VDVKEVFLPSGRRVVLPENDLEERVVVALIVVAVRRHHRNDRKRTFETFKPGPVLFRPNLSDVRFWSNEAMAEPATHSG
jgi:hypothetical protein